MNRRGRGAEERWIERIGGKYGSASVIGVGAAASASAGNLNPNVLKVICDARTKALKTHSLSDRYRERTESRRIAPKGETATSKVGNFLPPSRVSPATLGADNRQTKRGETESRGKKTGRER